MGMVEQVEVGIPEDGMDPVVEVSEVEMVEEGSEVDLAGMEAATEAGDSEEVLEEDLEVVGSAVDSVVDSEEEDSVEDLVVDSVVVG